MMTEQEPDADLLADLLTERGPPGDTAASDETILTRRDEQKLLDEANQVAPPTLAPVDIGLESLHSDGMQRKISSASFGTEAIELVRRYPMPALLLAAGLAYLLVRRRRP
jgi:hypothetical protein